MRFAEVLRREACVEIGARTRALALRELADALAEAEPEIDREKLLRELVAREELGTTGIADGAAIPHAWIDSIDGVVAGFGRSPDGVDFGSLDGAPTHLFFTFVAPPKLRGAGLQVLADLSGIIHTPGLAARLLEADRFDALLRVLDEAGAR